MRAADCAHSGAGRVGLRIPEPPNATEVSRFSSSDGVVIGWESSDSVDSVKGFYDDAIAEDGLNVYGTTDGQGAHQLGDCRGER